MKSKKSGQILFWGYIFILTWVLLFKFSISFKDLIDQFNNQPRNINLIPFKDSAFVNQQIDLSEIINNIIAFIPFGGLLSIVYKNLSFLKKVGVILLFSFAIETAQFIFGLGATDITDIITNVSGGIIGLGIYQLLQLIFDEKKLDRFLVFIGALLFVVCLLFVGFLIIVNR